MKQPAPLSIAVLLVAQQAVALLAAVGTETAQYALLRQTSRSAAGSHAVSSQQRHNSLLRHGDEATVSVYRGCKRQRRQHRLGATPDDEEPIRSSRDDEEDAYMRMLSEPGLQDVQGGPKILRRARGGKKVPLDQQPFNELQNLKEAPMFGWAQKDLNSFLLRLGGVYTGGALVSFPIARVTFPGDDQFAQLVLATNIGALGLVTALTLRLYAGWDYVAQRLDEDVVAYEQSGWYDGSTYAKPPDVQARDQMLSIYEARPVLKRLRVTLAVLASLFVTTIVAYRVLVPTDPYEMYGDAYLKDLPANEWKAKETAEASKAAGAKARPAYCGSRYYKALAGGNGCD